MRLARTHRRLAVLMSLASMLAFAGGAGVEPFSTILATAALIVAFFWQPSPDLSVRMERIWLPLALILVVRAIFHGFVLQDDVVIPVVDLLFLLLAAESLRSLEASNDARLYSLSFALLLAATAYRPGLLFLLAFLAYVGLATLALIYGHLRREGRRHGVEEISVPRSFLLTAGAMSAVTVLIAVLVFLTFPRVSRGWAGRGETLVTSIAGFSDQVTLGSHGVRIYGNPQIVLRVEFPNGTPSDLQSLHWRGRSYDRFDGIRWSRSSRVPPAQSPPAWYEKWGTTLVPQRIYGAPLDTRVLFALYPLLDVEADPTIQPLPDNAGDMTYWGPGPPSYTALSLLSRPSASQLRTARGAFVPARGYYTQLPPLSAEVRALADSLLAGLPTDYDRAVSLERWFQGEFTYTRQLPRTAREATLDYFLLQRRAGHCEYFSTAMTVLLRTQGIAAREVNGFLGGSWSGFGEYLAVTQNEAHAWVEVWFPGFGWVPFDPTPGGRGEGSVTTSWFWPGRFFFDALQHRWNKWVLDYSFQTQFNLFQRGRKVLARTEGDAHDEDGNQDPGGHVGMIWWGLLVVSLVGTGFWAFPTSRRVPPGTRFYLRLRESSRKAGVPPTSLHSPRALTDHLEAVRHPAAAAARHVVEGYLRARFSGRTLLEEEERELSVFLEEARTSLRKRNSG